MNINIPVIECYTRLEFMNQHSPKYIAKLVPSQIFGVASIPGQTPLFHSFADDGGIYWRLPLHAFCWAQWAPPIDLPDIVLWDSFSYHIHCCTFDLLKNKRMSYVDRSKLERAGTYMFTLDWFADERSYGFAEVPGQHKCGHMIRLDDGNFALQPNNRLKLFDPNFVVKDERYPRMLSDRIYSAEHEGKWRTTDDNDAYDYGIEDR